ncbi:MAG TPA: hypothetical protein VF787_07945 [Thermoanaerobaculia bacterium]
MKRQGLLDVVLLAMLSGVLVAVWLMSTHDGWSYYTTPLGIRGYAAEHRALRPSGTVGHVLGVAGTLFLFATLAYLARRRMKRLANAGSVARWLEIHIFCGVFGPFLVTFHTAFKFNGLVSVAYWSMVLVMLSGFVGRHLYVRIPKTMRGEELSRAQLDERAAELGTQLAASTLAPRLRARIEEEERRLLFMATSKQTLYARMREAVGCPIRRWQLRREIRAQVSDHRLLHETLALAHERALLLRRIARLEKTRKLFHLWHVFHRPLVWLMFFVFFVHLGVTVYFGYTPFGG